MPNISLARVGIPELLWRVAFPIMILMVAVVFAQSKESASQAVSAFEKATDDYVLMHRRVERQIGPIEFGPPRPRSTASFTSLPQPPARSAPAPSKGDFFTPSLGHVLRARINDALLEHHVTAGDVRAAGRVDGVDYERVRLHVNDTFPWVLADTHASLIVDILPHAIIDHSQPPGD